MKATIHLDDIRMVEEHLDLDLPCKLICYLLFLQQALLDYLQSADEVGISLAHQINSSIFAITQLFDLYEVLYTHLPDLTRDIPHSGKLHTIIILECGLDYKTTLHVATVDPAEEGWGLTRDLSTFFWAAVRTFWLLVLEKVNFFVGMEAIFLTLRVVQVGGHVFDGFTHTRDPSDRHVAKGFFLG